MLFIASQHGLILIFLKISEKWWGYSPPSPPVPPPLIHVTDMIVGLTYLLLVSCDMVRNSSQALTSGGTAASNMLFY